MSGAGCPLVRQTVVVLGNSNVSNCMNLKCWKIEYSGIPVLPKERFVLKNKADCNLDVLHSTLSIRDLSNTTESNYLFYHRDTALSWLPLTIVSIIDSSAEYFSWFINYFRFVYKILDNSEKSLLWVSRVWGGIYSHCPTNSSKHTNRGEKWFINCHNIEQVIFLALT